jgi:hypothetical protein
MDEVRKYLVEREQEVLMHLQLLSVLEKRSTGVLAAGDDFNVDVRQVLILKASILVHLYNVVEAVMAKALEVIENEIHLHHPKDYSEFLFDAWIMSNIRVSNEVNISKINERAAAMGRVLLGSSGWSRVMLQKTDGNWDNKRIVSFLERVGIKIYYPRGFKGDVFQPYFNDMTAMEYVRKRRNDLAHGLITFEEGADNKTYAELDHLSKLTLKFMSLVVDACQSYISKKTYLGVVKAV